MISNRKIKISANIVMLPALIAVQVGRQSAGFGFPLHPAI
jgi:hypothetical protein